MRNIEYTSNNLHDTEDFAEKLGKSLRGGEIIELIGDVGAGKTSFVRGLARGVGSVDRVSSPTFTVSQIYTSDTVTIHHYDFYRIDDISIMQRELAEVVAQDMTSVVLEWAGVMQDVLPAEHVSIRFEVTSESGRKLLCAVPETFKYLEFGK